MEDRLLKQEHAIFNDISFYFQECQDKVAELMELDEDQALKLFLSNIASLPVQTVVERLFDQSRNLFKYLDALYTTGKKEECKKFHGLLVSLYADYAPERLLSFLKNSDHYRLEVRTQC